MKRVLFMTIGFWLFGCSEPPVVTVILDSQVEAGWVVIEDRNDRCPPARRGRMSLGVPVPRNGFACTSADLRQLSLRHYFVMNARAKAERLPRSAIKRLASVTLRGVDVMVFWYAPGDEQVAGDPRQAIEHYLEVRTSLQHPQAKLAKRCSTPPS